jgi:hypothetical protein
MGRRQDVCPIKAISVLTISPTYPVKRFNIYIYDYCFKRGFRKTARELLLEAEIAPDATPPIDARQGLLFEFRIFLIFELIPLLILFIIGIGGGVSFGCFSKRNRGADPRMHWFIHRCADP